MTIELKRLTVRGKDVPEAEINFSGPLTVISGASNTGKSHIFQCIQFMLGGGDVPEGIPESDPYETIQLELNLSGREVLLERALRGGGFQLYARAEGGGFSAEQVLKPKHDGKRTDNISRLLLGSCELDQKLVRENEWGDQRSLSFSDLRKLILVDEVRIISRDSVFLGGQRQDETVERSVLGLLLSGIDDSAIVPIERKVDRDNRLKVEARLLQDLAQDTLGQLTIEPSVGIPDFDDQLAKLDASIDEASKIVSATQKEITSIETARRDVWSRLRSLRSRRLFLETQIERFHLLQRYYSTDKSRLLAMIEAESELTVLEETDCPICGRNPRDASPGKPVKETMMEFVEACRREISKIESQSDDLASTIISLKREQSDLELEENSIEMMLRELDRNLKSLLESRHRNVQEDLQGLISRRSEVWRNRMLRDEYSRLSTRLEATQSLSKGRYKKPELADKLDVRATVGLCNEMERLLTEWKFPEGKQVRFDPERQDFVIGNRNRGSLGKGYRAVVFAAFSIGLMRYCLSNARPHPGFVVIDTPLNPLKGPDEGEAGKVNEETKSAFYESLANSTGLGQVIVLENVDPSKELQRRITYHHFSKNVTLGRYGFYPIR